MARSVVIFDIDGTLSCTRHRQKHVDGEKKDFDKFYSLMHLDPVRPEIAHLAEMYDDLNFKIVLCTGRPEKYREVTIAWLDKFGIMHDTLMMRPDDQPFEQDYKIKAAMLEEIEKTDTVHLAIEDRNQVVRMWRDHSISCLQCADGDF